MNKKDQNTYNLKEAFISGKRLSNQDICDLLNIKRSRVYDYINKLKDEGITLLTEKEGHTTYYSLCGSLPEGSDYEPLTDKDILRFRILSMLSIEPLSPKQVCKKLNEEYDRETDLSSRKSTYYKELDEMLSENLLVKRKRPKKTPESSRSKWTYEWELIPTGKGYSLLLSVDTDKELMATIVSPAQAQGQALLSLQKKISFVIGDNADCEFDDSIFLQYGKKYRMDSKITDCFISLIENRYTEKVLIFDYNGKNGKKEIKFETALVVYSQDKDMLYLIGRKIGTHNTSILKYSEIENLRHTNEKNNEYNNPKYQKKYQKLLQDMFSVSTEKPVDVEVHFKNTPTNRLRLDRLCMLRPNAKYVPDETKLIYTDIISGTSDFARYLRSYGYDFQIIKPESLKKRIDETIERMLKRYE